MEDSPTPHHEYIPHVVNKWQGVIMKLNVDMHVYNCNRSYIYIYNITTQIMYHLRLRAFQYGWGFCMNAYVLLLSLADGALLLQGGIQAEVKSISHPHTIRSVRSYNTTS